jgi:hypothetical protein
MAGVHARVLILVKINEIGEEKKRKQDNTVSESKYESEQTPNGGAVIYSVTWNWLPEPWGKKYQREKWTCWRNGHYTSDRGLLLGILP